MPLAFRSQRHYCFGMSKQTAPQEFSARHIAELRERFSQLETVNPTGPTWQHFEKYVKNLS